MTKIVRENVREIANRLNVKEAEVADMENRLYTGDRSLNTYISQEADTEWQDMLIDQNETQDVILENKNEYNYRKNLLTKALDILNPREKEIIKFRRLSEKPKKLEELSKKYKISRERVRQIEEKAIEKLFIASKSLSIPLLFIAEVLIILFCLK